MNLKNETTNIKLTNEEKAYIAGFLDGDGSLIAQIIKGSNYKYGYTIRISIVFFQKKTKHSFMLKLKSLLKYGFIRIRNDSISEYVITGSHSVETILKILKKFLILKKDLADLILKIIEEKRNVDDINKFISLCELVDKTTTMNYSKKRIITSSVVKSHLIKGVETLTT